LLVRAVDPGLGGLGLAAARPQARQPIADRLVRADVDERGRTALVRRRQVLAPDPDRLDDVAVAVDDHAALTGTAAPG
jgi:hypothetical protein